MKSFFKRLVLNQDQFELTNYQEKINVSGSGWTRDHQQLGGGSTLLRTSPSDAMIPNVVSNLSLIFFFFMRSNFVLSAIYITYVFNILA